MEESGENMSDVNQARRTRFQCLFDGTDITSDIAPYLLSVTYIDNDDAEGDDKAADVQHIPHGGQDGGRERALTDGGGLGPGEGAAAVSEG